MQMPHKALRLQARTLRALLRASAQRLHGLPAPQTVRCCCMPLLCLTAQGLPTDHSPAKLAHKSFDCRFAALLSRSAAFQRKSPHHCFPHFEELTGIL